MLEIEPYFLLPERWKEKLIKGNLLCYLLCYLGLFSLCLFVAHQEGTPENKLDKTKGASLLSKTVNPEGSLFNNFFYANILISWGLTLMKR